MNRQLIALLSLSTAGLLTLVCTPVDNGQPPEQESFMFWVRSKPLAGYENNVDAVTKASNQLDSLLVMIDSIVPPDSLDSLFVDWGDGTVIKPIDIAKVRLGGLPNALTHWYYPVPDRLPSDTASVLCTTSCYAFTRNGVKRDTSFLVRVIPAIP